jgi:RNA polymerase sigma factor (sigma-70 family)
MTARHTPDQPSDEELFLLVAAGVETAFAEVVGRHVDAVFNHCLRWMGYAAEADDVASMTFFEAWRKRRTVRFVDGSALPWLLGVATNVARNQSRGRRRYERMLARLPSAESAPDVADEAIRNVDGERRAAEIAACVRTLRRDEQDVVALCDMSGLSYAEAAVALDIPVGTVRSRLSRARARLRPLLTELTQSDRVLPEVPDSCPSGAGPNPRKAGEDRS